MKRFFLLACLVAAALVVAGCGNKGPLQMPVPARAQPSAAASVHLPPPASTRGPP